MTGGRRRTALGVVLLMAFLLAVGCAGTVSNPADPASPGAAGGSAEQPPADRQVMVTYPPAPPWLWARTTSELAQLYQLRTIYSWTMASLGEQCVVFEVPRGKSPQDFVRRIASHPKVGSAQTVETFQVQGETDPYASRQYSSRALRLDQAHRWATGKGVRIAVVDTGVDFDHPDLRGRVVKAQSFVDKGDKTFTTDIHGTAVAGLIAASANNGEGIVGVAPGAEIYALKACWQQPPGSREAVCNSYTLAKAVDFAILQDVQVLNFSLAGPPDPLLGRLIGLALSKGIVVVAADGGTPSLEFPASLQGVIGILGSDPQGGTIAPAVPAGTKILSTLSAPSVDILTTAPKASYDFFSGSSFAAAQVSGIAALLLEKSPKLTPAQLAAVIRKTARHLPPPPSPRSTPARRWRVWRGMRGAGKAPPHHPGPLLPPHSQPPGEEGERQENSVRFPSPGGREGDGRRDRDEGLYVIITLRYPHPLRGPAGGEGWRSAADGHRWASGTTGLGRRRGRCALPRLRPLPVRSRSP